MPVLSEEITTFKTEDPVSASAPLTGMGVGAFDASALKEKTPKVPKAPKAPKKEKEALTEEQQAALAVEKATKRKEARLKRRESESVRDRERMARKAYRERQKELVGMGKVWRQKQQAEDELVAAAESSMLSKA